MKESECRQDDLLPVAFCQENIDEIECLLRAGHDIKSIKPKHFAMIQNNKFFFNFLQIKEVLKIQIQDLLEMMVDQTPKSLRKLLDFVSQNFVKKHYDRGKMEWNEEIKDGFQKFVSKHKKMFYLWKLKSLGDSGKLLKYRNPESFIRMKIHNFQHLIHLFREPCRYTQKVHNPVCSGRERHSTARTAHQTHHKD